MRLKLILFSVLFTFILGLPEVRAQAWPYDWSEYTLNPQDQQLQGPCLGFANALLINTQYRIEEGIVDTCLNFYDLPGVSPWGLHFYGIGPGGQSVTVATKGLHFQGRYEDGYLMQFEDCFTGPGNPDADCWFALDAYGTNSGWQYANIEKCAQINCPDPETIPGPNYEYVTIGDDATSGAKVNDYIDVSTANRSAILSALSNGPFVLRVNGDANLDILNDQKYGGETINYHAVLVIGIQLLSNNRFRLKVADSWPDDNEIYVTDVINNTQLSGSSFDAWRITGATFWETVNGSLVEMDNSCETPSPTCNLQITELGPTGSQVLTRNHPNRFRAKVSSPGAPLSNWTFTASGATVSSPTGSNTQAYFYVTPTNNFTTVQVTVECPNGATVTRVEAFQTSSGGGSSGGGWRTQETDRDVTMSVFINEQTATTFTDESPVTGKVYDLQLFSTTGQRVWQQEVVAGGLAAPNLAVVPGIYFVRMVAQDGSYLATKKIFLSR